MFNRSRGHRRRRKGAAALELAILLTVFLIMVLGMIEIGRAIMVQQMLVNAAREAARRAVVPGATDQQLTDIVNGYLQSAGVSGHALEVTPTLATAPSKSNVAVSVSVPFGDVSWGLARYVSAETVLQANVVMKKEQ